MTRTEAQEIDRLAERAADYLAEAQRAIEAAYRLASSMDARGTALGALRTIGVETLLLAGVVPETAGELAAALDEASGRYVVALIRARRRDAAAALEEDFGR